MVDDKYRCSPGCWFLFPWRLHDPWASISTRASQRSTALIGSGTSVVLTHQSTTTTLRMHRDPNTRNIMIRTRIQYCKKCKEGNILAAARLWGFQLETRRTAGTRT